MEWIAESEALSTARATNGSTRPRVAQDNFSCDRAGAFAGSSYFVLNHSEPTPGSGTRYLSAFSVGTWHRNDLVTDDLASLSVFSLDAMGAQLLVYAQTPGLQLFTLSASTARRARLQSSSSESPRRRASTRGI